MPLPTSEFAHAARDRAPALGEEIGGAIIAAVPALGGDPEAARDVAQGVREHVERVLTLLADPALPVDGPVPEDGRRLVRALLRRGGSPHDLVQAYRVGQNEFLRWWMAALSAAVAGPALVEALEASTGRVFAAVDAIVDELLSAWELEARADRAAARRTQVVQALLSDAPPTPADASRALDYELDRVLTGAVLWGDGDREAAATALAAAAGVERALTLPAGRGTTWAWIGTLEPPDTAVLVATAARCAASGVRVALGEPSIRGFRRSHEQAVSAWRLAGRAADPPGVIAYRDVEPLALVTSDWEATVTFVRRTLGPLLGPGEAEARLRATVATWLAEGRNARRTAARLGLHKNTVLYRLQRAAEQRGGRLACDQVPLQLALALVGLLGPEPFAAQPARLDEVRPAARAA